MLRLSYDIAWISLRYLTGLILAVNVNAQLTNKLITTAAHWNYQILGGELSNSAATSVNDIDEVLPRMKALGLNTVLVPVYWEFLEPAEGQMDFTLVDRTIDVARQQGLKIVPLWFGAWKNSMSCYVEHLAQAARRIHNMPLYVNAAMNSRGRKPGEYPSAGPLAHLANIWKAGAQSETAEYLGSAFR